MLLQEIYAREAMQEAGITGTLEIVHAQYWDMMQRAKYVLCPDGDFVWTYRFFEAVACGAIPIIERWPYLS